MSTFLEKHNELNIESKAMSLESFLSSKSNFLIRDFQRDYKWDKTEVHQLIDDLDNWDIAEMGLFLNSVTLSSELDHTDLATFEVVDGQQRIITTTLILKAYEILTGIDQSQLYLNEINSDTFAKLTPLRGSDTYQQILNFKGHLDIKDKGLRINAWKNFNKSIKDNKKIKDNLNTIINKFKKPECDSTKIVNVLKKSTIIAIKVPPTIPSTEIFESINSKGKPLTIDELIKNFFYLKASIYFKKHLEKDDYQLLRDKIEKQFMDVKEMFDSKTNGPFNSLKRYYGSYINYCWAMFDENKKMSLPASEENTRKLYSIYRDSAKVESRDDFNKELKSIHKYISSIGQIRAAIEDVEVKDFDDYFFQAALKTLSRVPTMIPLLYYLKNQIDTEDDDGKPIFNIPFRKSILEVYKYFIVSHLTNDKSKQKLSFNLITYFNKNNFFELNRNEKSELVSKTFKMLFNDPERSMKNELDNLTINFDMVNFDSLLNIKFYNSTKDNDEDSAGMDEHAKFLLSIINNSLNHENMIMLKDLNAPGSITFDHVLPQSYAKTKTRELKNFKLSVYEFDQRWKDSLFNLMIIRGKDDSKDNSPEEKVEDVYMNVAHSTNLSIEFCNSIRTADNLGHKYDNKDDIRKWGNHLIGLISEVLDLN